MTRKRKCNSQPDSFVATAEKVGPYVFSLFLNTDRDEADVTSVGTLQQQVGA